MDVLVGTRARTAWREEATSGPWDPAHLSLCRKTRCSVPSIRFACGSPASALPLSLTQQTPSAFLLPAWKCTLWNSQSGLVSLWHNKQTYVPQPRRLTTSKAITAEIACNFPNMLPGCYAYLLAPCSCWHITYRVAPLTHIEKEPLLVACSKVHENRA